VIVSGNLRNMFLEFFSEKGHRVVKSSSVIPHDDPTLLFTNAGMNQFKNIFLGNEKPSFRRAVSVQKCIRASGKHNDLEDVGKDGKHHTFFEMLGNWSFGDYYKKEAILWAWEFVTERMGLSPENLWISVYSYDKEAYDIWLNLVKIPSSRIIKLGDIEKGDEENFWSMGETGPCGPCSEIYYDYHPSRQRDFFEAEKSGDIIELWNLVFMEFNRESDGRFIPLPEKHIDTGMGLERALAIVQGVKSNYETDLFIPIIKMIEKLSGCHTADENIHVSFRVIADHIRCLCFAIADGAIPSNEGRGYVLRRILRRAVRYGTFLNLEKPFLHLLVEPVVEIMGEYYNELIEKREFMQKVILGEEELFFKTLGRGLEEFDKTVQRIKLEGSSIFPGEEAFLLHDTYGFPLDLTQIMAREKGFEVDMAGFEREMEKQRSRAREGALFSSSGESSGWCELREVQKTIFTGYETLKQEGMKLIRYKIEGDKVFLIFDITPFYGESGGQIGDRGYVRGDGVCVEIEDVKRSGELFIHVGNLIEGIIKDVPYTGEVDMEKRRCTMSNHTSTHLLHYALRKVVGEHALQAGSYVTPERLRFDFNHYSSLDEDEIERIEDIVNRLIMDNRRVIIHSDIPLQEAKRMGAIALFGEKYGDRVRVVEVEGVSLEFCGGTHVKRTGDIGIFRILKESAVASGIRRIEAISGLEALKTLKKERNVLKRVSELLRTTLEEIPVRIQELKQKNKNLELQLKKERRKAVGKGTLTPHTYKAGKYNLTVLHLKDYSTQEMREISDKLKSDIKKGVVFITSTADEKLSFILAVTEDAVMEGIHAGKLLGKIAKYCYGKGGGRPHLAQGGGKAPEKLNQMIEKLKEELQTY